MRVVLLQAATLPSEYKEGKLQAFRLLCAMMSRRQDLLPNSDFLVHFYFVLRLGLTSEDQVGALLRVPLFPACPPKCPVPWQTGAAAKTCCCWAWKLLQVSWPGVAPGVKRSVRGEEKT